MKAATIHEIKQELLAIKPARLTELCLRLARFKKENKELLTYLLFEAQDEQDFIAGIRKENADFFMVTKFYPGILNNNRTKSILL